MYQCTRPCIAWTMHARSSNAVQQNERASNRGTRCPFCSLTASEDYSTLRELNDALEVVNKEKHVREKPAESLTRTQYRRARLLVRQQTQSNLGVPYRRWPLRNRGRLTSSCGTGHSRWQESKSVREMQQDCISLIDLQAHDFALCRNGPLIGPGTITTTSGRGIAQPCPQYHVRGTRIAQQRWHRAQDDIDVEGKQLRACSHH